MNSKAKGNSFERRVCHQLSEWWTRDELVPRSDVFWRTASSGGRATQRAKKGKATKNHDSDITATDPIGQPLLDVVTIEVKSGYNKHSIADILDAPDTAAVQQYEQWIVSLQKSLESSCSMSWMLIAQRTRRLCICYFPLSLYNHLREVGASIPNIPEFKIKVDRQDVVAMKFQLFLDLVGRRHIEKIARGERR